MHTSTDSTLATSLRGMLLAAAVFAGTVPAGSTLASPLDWIGGEKVQGSGAIKKQTRELAHFTGVSLNLPGSMEVRIGNTESITIEADDNIVPLIDTVIESGVLKVRPIKRNMNLQARHLKFIVNAKQVERLSLGGSGAIEADALRGKKITVDLGGSGSISVKGMEAEAIALSVGGSGNLKSGAGSAGSLSVSIGGSGEVDVGQVRSRDASVSVAGSGEATVWVSNDLSVTIAGSGDVNYYGDPRLSRSVVGSGGTRRLGGAPR